MQVFVGLLFSHLLHYHRRRIEKGRGRGVRGKRNEERRRGRRERRERRERIRIRQDRQTIDLKETNDDTFSF